MSQRATSLALNRLRKLFGDPLFVRTSRGIQPTPFAERLADPLEAVLDRIRTDPLQQPVFDPTTVQRSMTFNLQDIGERLATLGARYQAGAATVQDPTQDREAALARALPS